MSDDPADLRRAAVRTVRAYVLDRFPRGEEREHRLALVEQIAERAAASMSQRNRPPQH